MTDTGTYAGTAPRSGALAGWRQRASRRLRPVGVLAERDFLLFWSGQSVSKIGNGMYQVGLAWSVYQLTGSTVAMGTVLAANEIPELVLLLLGGSFADRLSRRAVILSADSAACLVTAGLAVLAFTHSMSVSALAAGAFMLGLVTAFYGPAYSAMNKDLLRARDFRAANALLSMSGNGARVLGPAVAGLVYAFGGAGLVFAVDAVTFAIAITAMIFTRRASEAPRGAARSLRSEICTGLRYTAKTRWLRLILAVSLVVNFACLAPLFVLLPALIRSHHDGVGMLGILTTTQVLASIAGAAVIGKFLAKCRAGGCLLLLASAIGTGTVVLGLCARVPGALFLGVAFIGLGMSCDVIENTLLQSLVPGALLSRVYSVNMVVSFALLPAGYLLAGWLARAAGTASVFVAGGAALVAVCGCASLLPATRDLNEVRC